MRSIRQSFRNFRKRLTRKRLKSKSPSNTKKKVSTIKGRKISQRTKTPMVKKTTSSQRKSIGKHIKTKCLKSICNLKFDLESNGKKKLKAFFTNSDGKNCIFGSDISLKLCGIGDEVEVKQTFLGEGGFSRVFPIKGNDKKIVRVTRGFESKRENGYVLEKLSFKLLEKLNNADSNDSKHIVRIDKYGIYKTIFKMRQYFGLYSLQDKYLGGDLYDIQKEYQKEESN